MFHVNFHKILGIFLKLKSLQYLKFIIQKGINIRENCLSKIANLMPIHWAETIPPNFEVK